MTTTIRSKAVKFVDRPNASEYKSRYLVQKIDRLTDQVNLTLGSIILGNLYKKISVVY